MIVMIVVSLSTPPKEAKVSNMASVRELLVLFVVFFVVASSQPVVQYVVPFYANHFSPISGQRLAPDYGQQYDAREVQRLAASLTQSAQQLTAELEANSEGARALARQLVDASAAVGEAAKRVAEAAVALTARARLVADSARDLNARTRIKARETMTLAGNLAEKARISNICPKIK
jgi:hypothetical protein